MPPQQVEKSRLIVVWGNNATACNLHLVPIVNRAKRDGARLVVVDPKRVKIAEQADMHIALRPGTDVVLAFAVAAEIERMGRLDRDFIAARVHGFEDYMERARARTLAEAAAICEVPEEAIRTLAADYAEASPAAIVIGNGLERNRNGGAGIRAVFALAAIAGKFGAPGGGLVMGQGHAFPKTPDRLQRPDFAPAGTRRINILDTARLLLDEALDPPFEAVFIYNHNPVIVHPDQNRMRRALAREDLFIVGCDVAMTDSLAYADVVLPAATHFEHADIFAAYGHQFLQRADPVIGPVGESLPNTEIFRRLAARFGFDGPAFTASDRELMDDAFDAGDARLQGRRPSELPLGTALPMHYDGEEPVLFRNVFPTTPSGKIELASTYLEERYGQGVPDYVPLESGYPLALITPSSDKRITSTFGGLPWSDEVPPLEMHPDDAAARGLGNGARVKVWNGQGEVRLALAVTDKVRPGCVYSAKGAWLRTAGNGQTVAALAPSHRADIAEGACFNDCRVEVAAW